MLFVLLCDRSGLHEIKYKGAHFIFLFPMGNHIKFNFAYMNYLNYIENIIFKCVDISGRKSRQVAN